MTYCVIWQDGWRVALLHGTLKQPEPGVYRKVRDAIAASNAKNMALQAAEAAAVAREAA